MVTQEMVATRTKLYTVDHIQTLECNPETEHRYFYVIDGELLEDPMPTQVHGVLQIRIGMYLTLFADEQDSGRVMGDTSHYLVDGEDTVLRPDVSYSSHDRLANSPLDEYVRAMPDIAVEIKSPSNTYAEQRRKAQAYLRNGSTLVWLVFPEREGVEVWSMDDYGAMQSHFVGRDETLYGEPALPGFTLELSKLFPPEND